MTVDPTSAKVRYQIVLDVCASINPSSVIEIGVHKGARTKHFMNTLRRHPGAATWEGYDAFDAITDHSVVFNGKGPGSERHVQRVLAQYADIHSTLHVGFTEHTLWSKPNAADFVFIDGDHRTDSIRKDFESVRTSGMICFDDVVRNGPPGAGAEPIIQELEEDPAWCVEVMPTRVGFNPQGYNEIAFAWLAKHQWPTKTYDTIQKWKEVLTTANKERKI